MRALGRAYFGLQAVAGAAWWIGVFASETVRRATLGDLDPLLVAAFDIPLFVAASVLAAFGLRWACWIAAPWAVLVAVGLAIYATLAGLAGWGVVCMIAASIGSLGAGLLVVFGRIPSERVLRGPLAFREAGSASPGLQLRRTLLQMLGFWAVFLAVLPGIIQFCEFRWALHVELDVQQALRLRAAGLALLVAMSGLGLWSAVAMSTRGDGTPLPSAHPRKLVIAGPYRFVRNPMAVAGVGQAVGVGLILGSWLVVLYALIGGLYWNFLVRPVEEADLERRFGEPYADYRRHVRCWITRLKPVPGG